MIIYKTEKDNTIKYVLVLSPTLSIKAEISQEKDKENKTIFSLKSAVIEGKHTPQGKQITRTQLGTDLGLFYSNPEIRNFHNALPFLCSIIVGNNKSDTLPLPRKTTLLEGLKQRITNLRLLRLEPQITI